MDSSKIIWTVGIAGAAYLLYEYGVSQGWWSSLTGPSISTSVLSAAQQQALIAQATAQGLTSAQIQTALNSLATMATQCGAGWDPNSGTCATSAATSTGSTTGSAAGSTATGTNPPASNPPASNPPATKPPAITNGGRGPIRTFSGVSPSSGVTASQLMQAANATASTTYDPDQWNYYEKLINPAATTSDFSAQGWTRDASGVPVGPNGSSNQLTAAQYIALRQQAGLSGFMRGMLGLWDPTGYAQTVPMPYALVADDQDRLDYAYEVN